uniref:P-type domain-containing protein n=1 Tax=Pseudonaja textilis TaxID=8673 RepID=A0A670YTY5_PSETE
HISSQVVSMILKMLMTGSQLNTEQCNVPATTRINCGPGPITEAQCRGKHYCFDSNVLNVPWCFKPASSTRFVSFPLSHCWATSFFPFN